MVSIYEEHHHHKKHTTIARSTPPSQEAHHHHKKHITVTRTQPADDVNFNILKGWEILHEIDMYARHEDIFINLIRWYIHACIHPCAERDSTPREASCKEERFNPGVRGSGLYQEARAPELASHKAPQIWAPRTYISSHETSTAPTLLVRLNCFMNLCSSFNLHHNLLYNVGVVVYERWRANECC